MIRLNILYCNTSGNRFDLDYCLGLHMPMAKWLFGDATERVRFTFVSLARQSTNRNG